MKGYQRSYLRGLAHKLKPIVQVGDKQGLTDAVFAAVDQALSDHELIKVRLYRPEDKKAMAQQLGERAGAEVCGLVGHTVILYRRHPQEPKIAVPQRAGEEEG